MGFSIEDISGLGFSNGDFETLDDWTISSLWTIGTGRAILDRTTPFDFALLQFALPVIRGNNYILKFDITVSDFINEGFEGIMVNAFGQQFGPFLSTGIKTIELFNFESSTSFSFFSNSITIGDHAEIDFVTIAPAGNYITETLGINWPTPRFTDFDTGVNSEFWQNISSVNGKTKCLIGYDV